MTLREKLARRMACEGGDVSEKEMNGIQVMEFHYEIADDLLTIIAVTLQMPIQMLSKMEA